jgi:hypothetical protein
MVWPEDGPSRTMAERCEINKRTPGAHAAAPVVISKPGSP